MTTLECFDYNNITYEAAKEFSRIESYAFKDDVILKGYTKPESHFDDASLPSIAEYEKLAQRVDLFGKLVESSARLKYASVRSDPRIRVFLLKDSGRYVAGAYWVLPKYLDLPKMSLFRRIRNWFLQKWCMLREILAFGFKGNPFISSGVLREFDWASAKLGGDDTKERRDELHSLNLKQLKETSYPKDLTYYLNILCVRTDIHGKGFGKTVLFDSLKKLGPYKAPPGIVGPAKATLLSAPTARGFYAKNGFSIGAATEHKLPNGEFAPHTYYFLNLHTDRSGSEGSVKEE